MGNKMTKPEVVPLGWVLAAAAGLAAFGHLGPVSAQEYRVDLERENQVRFVSDAPLEDFEGKTTRIDGFLFLAGEGLGGETDLAESEFYFEVDLASLDTGIGLRNRHMRNNYLETDEFPYASFSGRVTNLDGGPPGAYRAKMSGMFRVHGIDRNRDIECTAEEVGPSLRVRCAFQVVLSDHEIPVPKLMFMKIDEVMELDLDFFLSPAGGGEGQ
ncbi:MAG: YceI family protein [Gemmatimonadetes bacterium]|nr:YceI family protein [Gemmatimonadota bacterium]NNM04966.1 YceI family protein [Gemmatimonadota bacterium]